MLLKEPPPEKCIYTFFSFYRPHPLSSKKKWYFRVGVKFLLHFHYYMYSQIIHIVVTMKHTLYKQVIYSKNNKSSSSNSLTTRPTTIKSIFCIRKRSLIVVSQGVVSVLNLFCSVAHQRNYLYLFCRSNQNELSVMYLFCRSPKLFCRSNQNEVSVMYLFCRRQST